MPMHLHMRNQAEVKSDLEYLTMCDPNFSTLSLLWCMTHCANRLHLTYRSNFRICLLLGCHSLESDASTFSLWSNGQAHGGPSCKLCSAQLEDAPHFMSSCPALESKHTEQLRHAPPQLQDLWVRLRHIPTLICRSIFALHFILWKSYWRQSTCSNLIID